MDEEKFFVDPCLLRVPPEQMWQYVPYNYDGEGWAAERKRKGDIFRERERVKIESFEFSGLCGTVVDYDSRWVWVQLDDADPESDPEAFRDHHLIWDWSVMTSSDKDVDKVVKVRDLAGKCGTVVSNSGHKVTVAVDGFGGTHASMRA